MQQANDIIPTQFDWQVGHRYYLIYHTTHYTPGKQRE